MARQVPGYAAGKERRFIPESFENRNDDEPITIWIKSPTEREKRAVMGTAAASVEYDAAGAPVLDADGNPKVKLDLDYSIKWQNAIVEKFVTRIENYTASDGSQITSSAQLLEHGESEIISEAAAEVLTSLSLSENEKKSSAGLSDTTQKATPQAVGTADNAKPADLQSSAGVV